MQTVFEGKKYRISVLTNQLIRLEYSENGYFEDRLTRVVQNREFTSELSINVIEDENRLEIITDSLHLHYDKSLFSNSG